ncbi:hypothetical protein D9757_000080 [Collybiopsis confluens]|uniref:HMG box domain-containing protein n=1 Tax=Collybiopsis confluens TaxID=2823264 RepID=A0A8H5I2L1_9AGAR|nr:hypothetical protein D9757_000080 [Collybiopsis confluens]
MSKQEPPTSMLQALHQYTENPAASDNSASAFTPSGFKFPTDCDLAHYYQGLSQSCSGFFDLSDSNSSSPSPAPSETHEHIPRPPNSFMLFRSDFLKRDVIPASVEKRQQTLSRVAGEVWNLMSAEEKKIWHDKAAEALKQHNEKFPNYKFSPARRGSARKNKSKGTVKDGISNRDRIRELRETYLDVQGPARSSSRRRKNSQQALMPGHKARASTETSSSTRSMEPHILYRTVIPVASPRPTYAHTVVDRFFCREHEGNSGDYSTSSTRHNQVSSTR